MKKRVVVTGLGALTPIGNTVQDYWNALLAGVSGANLITKFDTTNFKTKFACEVKNFNPDNFIDKKEMRFMDACSQYAMVSCLEAVSDSGIDFKQENKERIGVILGTGIGGYESIADAVNTFRDNGNSPRLSPYQILKVLGNLVAGNIALHYDLRGVSYIISSACASSSNAISSAYNYILLDKADIIISGGSEACILETPIGGFNAMRALSTKNEEFASASRPFDVSRDGFVMGEGSGILILEEYEHAKARGAKIYAELSGIGLSTDTFHVTSPNPNGLSALASMKGAIEDAHLKTTDIDHINTHATSTPIGDVSECLAIATLFEEHAYKMAINSTKSMTGHLLGAAGAIEAIATILTIKNGIVPPTINLLNQDPAIPNFNFCANKAVKKSVSAAISNSFGFGGHNSSLLFTKID